MSHLVINDLFEELSQENNRLLNELLFAQKCIELLKSYRNYLNVLSNECNCNPIINNKLVFSTFEKSFKFLFESKEFQSIEQRVANNKQFVNNNTICKKNAKQFNFKHFESNENNDTNERKKSVRSIDRKSVDTNHTFINNHLSLNDSEESDNSCQTIVDENEDKIEDNFNNNKTRVWFRKLNKQEIGAKLRDNDYEIESVSNNQWISGLIH
jgi:hypothetical protein